jgi:MFS transporter, DHA3 family, macrolide efflux protein
LTYYDVLSGPNSFEGLLQNTNRPTGLFGFTIVWLGQIVSVLATNMSAFALMIWAFEEAGSGTALGLMQLSDLMAGLATIVILVLQAFGVLELDHEMMITAETA